MTIKKYKQTLFSHHILLFLWCLKRGMNQAQEHKKIALGTCRLYQATLVRIIFNPLVTRFIVPVLFKIKIWGKG